MEPLFLLMIFVVGVALIFDLINGFHDAGNSVAVLVATKVLKPRQAVLWAAFFNFIAMFVFAPHVADTIAKIVIIESGTSLYYYVVLAALLGAIGWNLLTWRFGFPSSSSHALIGALVGAGWAHGGFAAIHMEKVSMTMAFIVCAPVLGALLAVVVMNILKFLTPLLSEKKKDVLLRRLQFISASVYSLGHGGNDAQKTMGIIVFLLIAAGHLSKDTHLSLSNPETLWIILVCNLAMGLGTLMGGWRIIKTMGFKITKLGPTEGAAAQTAGAIALFGVTWLGIPVSTTHTIVGSIAGSGLAKGMSHVRWKTMHKMFVAWFITIPSSALFAALIFKVLSYLFA